MFLLKCKTVEENVLLSWVTREDVNDTYLVNKRIEALMLRARINAARTARGEKPLPTEEDFLL